MNFFLLILFSNTLACLYTIDHDCNASKRLLKCYKNSCLDDVFFCQFTNYVQNNVNIFCTLESSFDNSTISSTSTFTQLSTTIPTSTISSTFTQTSTTLLSIQSPISTPTTFTQEPDHGTISSGTVLLPKIALIVLVSFI